MLHVFYCRQAANIGSQHRSVIYRASWRRKKLLWCNSAPICGISVFRKSSLMNSRIARPFPSRRVDVVQFTQVVGALQKKSLLWEIIPRFALPTSAKLALR